MVAPEHGIELLCVCTHNRTRSVLMQALLGGHLAEAGIVARLQSAGLHGNGGGATSGALEHLALRGYDASGHVSRLISADDVAGADLIVTSEKMHVAEISGVWYDAFERSFTLPELVARANGVEPGVSLAEWLTEINRDRPTALEYLDADIGEIPDPTGEGPSEWRRSVRLVDDLAGRLATTLAKLDLDGDTSPIDAAPVD